MIEENQGAGVAPEAAQGGEGEADVNTRLAELEAELSKRDETIGSLKRDLKDAKKTKETAPSEKNEPPESNVLIEKAFLRSAGITDKEEVELALTTAKKWDMSIDALVDDEDFKGKLEKHRTAKSNALATSNIRGDKGGGSAKDTPAYWIAKGTAPTADQVPDRKTRAVIARAMIANTKSGKKFYSD